MSVKTTVIVQCWQSSCVAAQHLLCSSLRCPITSFVDCRLQPTVNVGIGTSIMAQLKTYKRKARPTDTTQGAYNSSQETFFDSPDDPYFFDSQQSAGHVSQPSVNDRSTLLSSSSDRSATGALSSHSQLPSTLRAAAVLSNAAATLPSKHARLALPAKLAPAANSKQAQSASLSRLSQSSTVGAQPASALPAKQKHSSTASVPATVEGPVLKKARLKRSSCSSINQARNSGSSSGKDKPQQASGTTVLEVITARGTWYCPVCQQHTQGSLSSLVCRHKKVENTHRLLMI